MSVQSIEYARVLCRGYCGLQILTQTQYREQMANPDASWKCPSCGCTADFDDDRWDELHQMPEDFE